MFKSLALCMLSFFLNLQPLIHCTQAQTTEVQKTNLLATHLNAENCALALTGIAVCTIIGKIGYDWYLKKTAIKPEEVYQTSLLHYNDITKFVHNGISVEELLNSSIVAEFSSRPYVGLMIKINSMHSIAIYNQQELTRTLNSLSLKASLTAREELLTVLIQELLKKYELLNQLLKKLKEELSLLDQYQKEYVSDSIESLNGSVATLQNQVAVLQSQIAHCRHVY